MLAAAAYCILACMLVTSWKRNDYVSTSTSSGVDYQLNKHAAGLHVCIMTADVPGSVNQGGTATAYNLLARALAQQFKKVTLLGVTTDQNE